MVTFAVSACNEARIGVITHQEIDAKSLAMTRRVVAKICANPSLFEQVKAALKHQQEIGSPNSKPYRDKWQSLVDQGMEVCLCAAVDESEQGKAMRQASPFRGSAPKPAEFVQFR